MRIFFEYKNYKFEGGSEGGVSTSVFFLPLKWLFDMGYQNIRNLQADRIFLSHSHLDHSMSLPYYLSQRTFRGKKKTEVYVPKNSYHSWKKIIDLYSAMENFEYNYNLNPVESEQSFLLENDYTVKIHKTYHRVDSVGYTVLKKTKKLKQEYCSCSSQEIVELKKKNKSIFKEIQNPILSFSGDTKIEYVLENELVQNSKILFLECTYIDHIRTIEQTREWGHIHLDEIVKNIHFFKNEKVVLMHFSKRYKNHYIKEIFQKKLNFAKEKFHLFLY